MIREKYIGLLLASAALSLSVQANAQAPRPSDATPSDADIVVTAQKRSEKVLEVPISMTVVGAEQLQRQQINTIQDLAQATPQVSFTAIGEGSPGGGAVVRGIGTQAFSRSASSSVGIVIDGVPTGNVNISNLFDLARVEVLAGPQGTLFGDSVSAGLINLVTNEPDTNKFSGRVSGEFAPEIDNIHQRTLRGVLNVPLGDRAAVRMSGYTNRITGPTKNVLLKDDQFDDQYGGRIRLLMRPLDGVTFNLIADYNESKRNQFFNVYVDAKPGSPLPAQLAACGITLSADNLSTCGSDPTNAFTKNWGVSGQFDIDVGTHTLTSISSYRDQDTVVNVDVDGLPAGKSVVQIYSGPETHPASLTTQELRLTSPTGGFLEYVVGGFYSRYDSHHRQPSQVTITPFPGFQIVLPPSLQTTDTVKKDYAIFGQATLNFAPNIRGIIGLRHNWSSLDDVFTQGGVVRPLKGNVTNLSFKVGLQYDVSRDANLYATITRGYKGPQANNIDTTQPPVLVLPEVPMYYEIGSKVGAFNGRLIVSAALYYANIDGYQAQYCAAVNVNNPTPVCAPNNVSGVISKGFDFLVFGRPADDITINTGVTYAHATYPKGYLSPDGTDLSGRQLSNAPRWRATFSGEYSPRLSADLKGLFAVNADYQTKIGLNLTANPNEQVGARTVVGGRIGVRYKEDWTIALFARNLFDKRIPIGAGPGVSDASEPANSWRMYTSASGRVIGISVDGKF